MKYLVYQIYEDGEVIGHKLGPGTTARHGLRGKPYIFLHSDTVLKNPMVTTDESGKLVLIEDPAKELEAQVTERYNEMVSEIYAEMLVVFGTKNDISASAFAATWEAMKNRPQNYVDISLGFTNEIMVNAFADSKLLLSDNYAKFRLKRIAQYQEEKSVILGGS